MSSDDDKLLRELGAFARASSRASDAPRLEPLGAEREAEIAARLVEVARARNAQTEPETQVGADELLQPRHAAGSVDPASQARVIDLRAARARRLPWLLLPLAAAAGLALWLSVGTPAAEPIPEYALQIAGAQAALRSSGSSPSAPGGAPPAQVGRTTELQLLLRPSTAVAGDVTALAFLHAGASQIAWPARIEAADSGALRVLLAPPPAAIAGDAALQVVVGRAAVLSADGEQLARGAPDRGEGFQRFRIPLVAGRD